MVSNGDVETHKNKTTGKDAEEPARDWRGKAAHGCRREAKKVAQEGIANPVQ